MFEDVWKVSHFKHPLKCDIEFENDQVVSSFWREKADEKPFSRLILWRKWKEGKFDNSRRKYFLAVYLLEWWFEKEKISGNDNNIFFSMCRSIKNTRLSLLEEKSK
jgi:hypothetical protein